MAEGWTSVAREDQLAERKPFAATVDGKDIFVVKIDGRYYAACATCSHYGGPLDKGIVADGAVTCPWHSSRFDVSSGGLLSPPALDDVCQYEVKAEGGEVFVGPRTAPRKLEVTVDDERVFVTVGAGAAAIACADELRRGGFRGRIVMATRESYPPYDRPALSKQFMAGASGPDDLPLRKEDYYRRMAIEVFTEREVTGLDTGARSIRFSDGNSLAYDKLLLATGGKPRSLPVPGADLPNVNLLRTRADAESLVRLAGKSGRAVMVGASFIGMEVAASLRNRGLDVCVVGIEETPMQKGLGRAIGGWLRALHEKNGVRFRMNSTVAEFRGDGRLERVRLSDGTEIEADMAIVGVGVRPATDFLLDTGLLGGDGGIIVDERMATAIEGVFAAGDIAALPGLRRIEHWTSAQAQGRHAARAMLGGESRFREPPFFWTRQFGVTVQYFGWAAEHEDAEMRGRPEQGSFLVGYFEHDELRSVAGIGRSGEVMALGEALREGERISRSDFLSEQFDPAAALWSAPG